MKPLDSSRTVIIEDEDVAAFLLDYETQQLLHPFVEHDRSLSDAAKTLGISMSALHYQVKKMLKHELLELVGEEKRAGRAIKRYRFKHQRYFIPFGVTRAETLEQYLAETKSYFEKLLTKNVAKVLHNKKNSFKKEEQLGILVYWDQTHVNQMCTQMVSYPDLSIDCSQQLIKTHVLDFYFPHLQLDEKDAEALTLELAQLAKKYAAKNGRHKYLLHIGLTPLAIE